MAKKRIFFLMGTLCLFGVALFGVTKSELKQEKCAFCDPQIINAQKFYEDDLVYALYTHKPVVPAHLLVLPKRHVERFENLSDAEILRIGQVIKKIDQAAKKVFDTSSYMLMQKNGREVGQTVPHVHVHYMARKIGDDSGIKFIIKMYVANAKSPISHSKMKEKVEKLKLAMESIP